MGSRRQNAPDHFKVKSCGVLILRSDPIHSFLLMKHPGRWDLPKGHVDPGETELECALRELEEETGIVSGDIQLDTKFRYEQSYNVKLKRYGDRSVRKSLVIFLATLTRDVRIVPTEHESFEWFDWKPPHDIQEQTINPLLLEVGEYLNTGANVFNTDGDSPEHG